jgi:hypothetical protein
MSTVADSLARGPRARSIAGVLVLAAVAAACDRGPTEAPAGPPLAQRVENESLDLALARVPAGLVVRANGADIRLGPAAGGGAAAAGEITIAAGEASDYGIDVVQIANDQQSSFAAAPRGEFFGAQKLVTPLGEATYARGRFDAEDGSRVEEARAYVVHPAANRLVTVTYRYPAGEDSRERVAALLEVLGEIEARTAPAPAAPAPPAGA